MKLEQHDLKTVFKDKDYYENITAIHRIALPKNYGNGFEEVYGDLILLEHKALAQELKDAKVWWKNNPHWCGELQRQQRFRDSKKDEAYYLCLESAYRGTKWKWKNEAVSPAEFGEPSVNIKPYNMDEPKSGNCFWFDQSALNVYQQLADEMKDEMKLSLSEVSERFGEVRLIEYENNSSGEYSYHPQLGVYQDI